MHAPSHSLRLLALSRLRLLIFSVLLVIALAPILVTEAQSQTSSAGTLFGTARISESTNIHMFVKVDPLTGVLTPISRLPVDSGPAGGFTALDSVSHRYFYPAYMGEEQSVRLLVLDTQTGALLASPTLLSTDGLTSLQFDSITGTLFGTARISESTNIHMFVKVDPLTGVLTPISRLPVDSGPAGGFTALDSVSHRYFYPAYVGEEQSVRLLVLDTQTGALLASPTLLSTDGLTSLQFVVAQSRYHFSGFFQPVDNLPTQNVVKAGRAIPVKFSLGGDQGLDIFATGYPTSAQVTCGATAEDAIQQTAPAGSSGLSYDVATDQYNYVWKTDKAWAGSCRTLVVKLNDGTVHRANFQFK